MHLPSRPLVESPCPDSAVAEGTDNHQNHDGENHDAGDDGDNHHFRGNYNKERFVNDLFNDKKVTLKRNKILEIITGKNIFFSSPEVAYTPVCRIGRNYLLAFLPFELKKNLALETLVYYLEHFNLIC